MVHSFSRYVPQFVTLETYNPVRQRPIENLLAPIQLPKVNRVHVIKNDIPAPLVHNPAVNIQHIILHRKLSVKPRMRQLIADRKLLPGRRFVRFLFTRQVNIHHIIIITTTTTSSSKLRQRPQQFLLISLPIPPSPSTLTTTTPLFPSIISPRFPQSKRKEPVPLNIPREKLVEKIRVDILLRLLMIMHTPKHDPSPLVERHRGAGTGWVGRVGRFFSSLPSHCWKGTLRRVRRRGSDTQKKTIRVDHAHHFCHFGSMTAAL